MARKVNLIQDIKRAVQMMVREYARDEGISVDEARESVRLFLRLSPSAFKKRYGGEQEWSGSELIRITKFTGLQYYTDLYCRITGNLAVNLEEIEGSEYKGEEGLCTATLKSTVELGRFAEVIEGSLASRSPGGRRRTDSELAAVEDAGYRTIRAVLNAMHRAGVPD